MPAPGRRRLTLTLCAVVLALAASGCRVALSAGVHVERDGSGVVSAGVGMDDAALAQLGDPAVRLRVDDLRAAGWRVEEPRREGDGMTWVRASKPFATAEEGSQTAAELSGPDGPWRDLAVERSPSTWRTTTSFSGVLDLTRGLAGLVDPEAAALLGDEVDLGPEGLVRRLGPDAGERITVELEAVLPGARGGWRGSLGQAVAAELVGRHWHASRIAAAAIAVLLGVAALVAAGRRSRRR